MSNLLKSVYFNVDPEKVCVINSDEKVENYIPNIYETPNEPEAFSFPELEDGQDAMAAGDFEDGLSVISMNEVMDQERRKLSEQLQQEQEEILENARQEAEQILAEAQNQADTIKEEAREAGKQQGIEEGRLEAEQELVQMKQALQNEHNARLQELDEQERGMEPAFADIVVSLVHKLTGVVCEDKKDVILYLIGNAVKNLGKTKQMMIRVSKADMGRVSAKKATFKAIAGDVIEFDIMEDDNLSENQCIIETENKIIDCSLDVQLQNLEQHIKMLAY